MKKGIKFLVLLVACGMTTVINAEKFYHVGNYSTKYTIQVWPKGDKDMREKIGKRTSSAAPWKTVTATGGRTVVVFVEAIGEVEYTQQDPNNNYLMVDVGNVFFANTRYATGSVTSTVKVIEFKSEQAAQKSFPQYFK
jgi:hypothetical protein